MKTIYYVIEKQLESSKWGEETNGNKDVRAYEVRNGKLELIAEITQRAVFCLSWKLRTLFNLNLT
jgi:hypothetical protein